MVKSKRRPDGNVGFPLVMAAGRTQSGRVLDHRPDVHADRQPLDRAACLRAVQSRDERFDGWFYTAVTSTKIYCRPSCPAMTPKPANMRFYPSAAAAQQAGFRACKRCRPDASPG